MLIDSGIGNGKLTDKQLLNFVVPEQSKLKDLLEKRGLTVNDIDAVLMTNLHYDNACGLTKKIKEDTYETVFKNAIIYTSEVEWHEMRKPNIRSVNSYWEMNWKPIVDQVETFKRKLKL